LSLSKFTCVNAPVPVQQTALFALDLSRLLRVGQPGCLSLKVISLNDSARRDRIAVVVVIVRSETVVRNGRAAGNAFPRDLQTIKKNEFQRNSILKLPRLPQNPNASAILSAHTSHLCSAEPILSTGVTPCIRPGRCPGSLRHDRMKSLYRLHNLTLLFEVSAIIAMHCKQSMKFADSWATSQKRLRDNFVPTADSLRLGRYSGTIPRNAAGRVRRRSLLRIADYTSNWYTDWAYPGLLV